MIKNLNIDILKSSKLKLCTIGTIGIILSASLMGCTTNNISPQENSYNLTESSEEMVEEAEKAKVNLEYPGSEKLPDRDIITFTNKESEKISAIAATNNDKHYVNIAPGEYIVTSNYLETTSFEITAANEEWNVEANYNTNTFTITEKTDTKAK